MRGWVIALTTYDLDTTEDERKHVKDKVRDRIGQVRISVKLDQG